MGMMAMTARRRHRIAAFIVPAFVTAHLCCACPTGAWGAGPSVPVTERGAQGGHAEHDCCPGPANGSHREHAPECGHCSGMVLLDTAVSPTLAVPSLVVATVLSPDPKVLQVFYGTPHAIRSRHGPPLRSCLRSTCVLRI